MKTPLPLTPLEDYVRNIILARGFLFRGTNMQHYNWRKQEGIYYGFGNLSSHKATSTSLSLMQACINAVSRAKEHESSPILLIIKNPEKYIEKMTKGLEFSIFGQEINISGAIDFLDIEQINSEARLSELMTKLPETEEYKSIALDYFKRNLLSRA